MAQAVCHRPVIAEAWFRCQGVLCGICGEKCGTGMGVSLVASVESWQYHSTRSTYSSFIHLPSTQYKIRI
jgi:ferredoxin